MDYLDRLSELEPGPQKQTHDCFLTWARPVYKVSVCALIFEWSRYIVLRRRIGDGLGMVARERKVALPEESN